MAPKKLIQKPDVANASLGVRRSQRIIAQKSATSGRHLDEMQQLIPQLNDDCLLEIFSKLPIVDLLDRVALCSRQFNALAYDAVKRKCRDDKFVCYDWKRDPSIVERFGKFMRNVEFLSYNHNLNGKQSMAWLKYCTALRTLTVTNIALKCHSECANILQNLENFTFWKGDFSRRDNDELLHSARVFVKACQNLKSIEFKIPQSQELAELLADVPESALMNVESMNIAFCTLRDGDVTMAEVAIKIAQLKNLEFFGLNFSHFDILPIIDALSASQSLKKIVLRVYFVWDKSYSEVPCGNFVEKLEKFPNLRSCEITYLKAGLVGTKLRSDYLDRHSKSFKASCLRLKNFHVVERGALSATLNRKNL